ncbi:uncharacterized protein [Amphiura filiformis]|uniref:uncharacterized protein n=1 Tax=Amphiura filiformis TaxID=82378 RepID=UPI003B21DA0D
MGQIKSRRSGLTKSLTKDDPACIINILIDDVLLKIFSFLIISEKLTASRTCKRWHCLIKEPHLWQTVDLWNDCNWYPPPHPTKDKQTDKSVNTTLRFLQSYTDSSLRVVYLRASNWALMRYLTTKCPNLQTLSFLSPDQHPLYYCNKDIIKYFSKTNFALPSKLKKLQLSFVARYSGYVNCVHDEFSEFQIFSIIQFRDIVIPGILQCQNLRHLTLYKCYHISQEDVEMLTSGLPKLQEICLLHFTTSFSVRRGYGQAAVLEEILQKIINNLRDLTSRHYITAKYVADEHAEEYSMDDILQELSHRQMLKHLHVTEAFFNPESFATMTQALGNMTELGLCACNCVTDDIMKIIARDLSNLKVLLLNDSIPYTDIGLKALKYHSTLQSLTIFQEPIYHSYTHIAPILSTEAIFETLLSLPKLKQAKLLYSRRQDQDKIIFHRYLDEFRTINPHVRICSKYEFQMLPNPSMVTIDVNLRKRIFFR